MAIKLRAKGVLKTRAASAKPALPERKRDERSHQRAIGRPLTGHAERALARLRRSLIKALSESCYLRATSICGMQLQNNNG